MKEYLPEGSSQTKLPDWPLDIGFNLQNDLEKKSMATKRCQTDIGLVELEEAMHAFTMLKALQQKDDDEASMEDSHGVIELPDDKTDSNYFDTSRDQYKGTSDLQGSIEYVECVEAETDHNLHDNSVLSYGNSKAISGLMEGQNSVDQCDNRDLEDVDTFDHLISGKPEESTDQGRSRKTLDDTQELTTQEMHDKLNEDFPNEEKVTKKRRFMTRSDSVSTDESNFSDEVGNVLIEDLLNRPNISAKSENSPAKSELSYLASKRGRRIGVSAEPVRLPTWTELRESIKLNQQIYLEEEMTNEEVSETPGNSIDDAKVDCKAPDINYNNPDENIDCQRISDGSNLADTSMEWCYEFPKDQTGK